MARAILSNEAKFRWFLNDAAGMGFNEDLGLGIQGWLYYLKDMSFCGMLMTGVDSLHCTGYFPNREVGLKRWSETRQNIEAVAREAEDFVEEKILLASQ
jgi:dimethylaniline monooxygenase (N-oxide forming)